MSAAKHSLASITLSLTLLVSATWGQRSNLFPVLGGQRAGTSAYSFLKIPLDARGVALAGAAVALKNNRAAVFWNPAALAWLDGNRNLQLLHANWMADVQLEGLTAAVRLGRVHHWAVSALALHMPPMAETDEYHPDGTGATFNYGDVQLGLHYALTMTDRFSFGVALKLVEEQLAELAQRDVLLDFGTFYWTGFRTLRLAVALMNFGSPSAPRGGYTYVNENGDTLRRDYQEFAPPTIFRLGSAYTWGKPERTALTLSVQLNHPVDNAENLRVGLELVLKKRLYLRTGKAFNRDAWGWTAGVGVRSGKLSFDYAYLDRKDLQGTEFFTLGWSF